MRILILSITAVLTFCISATAQAFCGFYVARADTALFNKASQVVLVRDGDRTVITMANDFQGDTRDFAMVIPVPTVIERGQINVADPALLEHLDAYTAPRLVEYHDADPCNRYEMLKDSARASRPMASTSEQRQAALRGVTIEASYTVCEYDILILSAKESGGLLTWLTENGYRLPDGAQAVVGSYLKQGMRFFVAKVNLGEQEKLGYARLRPLQIAFESGRFMLPIRLGTLNADGAQELFIYTLTRTGRVETTNYRTVRLPSNSEVPEYIGDEFSDFYRAMFTRQVEKENQRAVFLEYAWDMAWCDPCAADPLSADELRRLGVFWIDEPAKGSRKIAPQARNVFVTRLHVRYDKATFPEDLMFHETGDRSNFQGRYIIRHPFKGKISCGAENYRAQVRARQEREAATLASLTGWDIDRIRERIPTLGDTETRPRDPWWKSLWD